MATKTIGTNSTTVLQCIQVPSQYASIALTAADIATIRNLILDDIIGVTGNLEAAPGGQATAKRIWPGSLDAAFASALLSVPNRGTLKLLAGDWIVVDPNTGSVFMLPANTVAGTATATGTTTNNQPTITFASSVLALGWAVNMPLTGTNVPASSTIIAISQDGKTVTISANATGSAANTMTVGNWTHS